MWDNKLKIASMVVVFAIPLYAWKKLYSTYKALKAKYEQDLLFHERHNCVVMYASNEGMSGWPPHRGRIAPDISSQDSLDLLKEPVLYFIDTAQETLDVAFMFIGVKSVYTALTNAHNRGVKVRVIMNFEHCKSKLTEIRQLKKDGISVMLYVATKLDMSNIMHYKFLVKDYTDRSGYVLTGSLNLSDNAFLNNYEDIVIISNKYMANEFHSNFDKCWDYIKLQNESIINKTVLLDACLI